MGDNGNANISGDVKGDKAEYTRQGTYGQEPPILKIIDERFEELEETPGTELKFKYVQINLPMLLSFLSMVSICL